MNKSLVFLCYFLQVWCRYSSAVFTPSGGPVYVNPEAAAAQSIAIQQQQNEAVELLTQTVYGFLDFTTTIGNTVMVFSPQSALADGGKKTAATTSSIIETKPTKQSSPAAHSSLEIKPSKITENKVAIPSPGNSPSNKKTMSNVEVKVGPPATIFSSVVEVRGGENPTRVADVKEEPSNIIEIKTGASSIVEIRGGGSSALSSKVEVRGGTSILKNIQNEPSTKLEVLGGPSSVVEVKTGPSKILFSRVEVVGGEIPPSVTVAENPQDHDNNVPTILSSMVEVRSSSEEPALSGNNVVEPEYDFLSRQPSEVVDETYKIINLRPSSKFHLKSRQSDIRSKVNVITSQRDEHGIKATRGAGELSHPTGLVTTLGGTVVKEGVTTVHETSVIGTYISGKYAQVLQSTSHIFPPHHGKVKPTPSSSMRILKTAAPVPGKSRGSAHLEPTPAGSLYDETVALPLEALFSSAPSPNFIKSSRKPGGLTPPKNSLHSRFQRGRGRESQDNREQELVEEYEEEEDDYIIAPSSSRKPTSRAGTVKTTQSIRSSLKLASKNAFSNNRFGRVSSTPELATVSVFSDSPSATPSGGRRFQPQSSQRRSGFRPSSNAVVNNDGNGYSRRGYKPRVQSSSVDSAPSSTSLYKFKLARPAGRWQYKTTPKPRVNIRKQNEEETLVYDNMTLTTTQQPHPQFNPAASELKARSDDPDQEPTGSDVGLTSTNNEEFDQAPPVAETIKVEISTPAEFKDTYYEIATIRSPYTFQVGTVKNTRFITVTSTFEKSLDNTESPAVISSSATEPLTENILASTIAPGYDKENNLPLDSSIATLPPIGLAGDAETPPLETLTETFSTTQLLLKTHILPVIRGGSNTTRYTLVQSYHVTRLVTATKTLPPMEVYHFVPSKTLNEFNTHLEEAGSELHLELEFGDDNSQDDEEKPSALRALQPDIDLANIGSDFDLSDVDKTRIPEGHIRLKKAQSTAPKATSSPEPPPTPALSPEQVQQLALLRLLNPAAAIPQVITTSRPILKVETVYESHVLPIINGASTSYSTISRPVATVSKTEYEYGTSTLPALPVPPVNQLNPLFPQQQHQQFAITSTPVVTQTVVTETDSKVLKLTFGAKTAYTTLLSIKVVPTVLTTYVTASIPVQPSAPAFPGYFPAPYPQFPYVG